MVQNLANPACGWTLTPQDPPVASVLNRQARAPYVVLADHGGRAIPEALHNLGLPDSALERHIAYDIGALELAKALSASLDAPLVWANYSRLVVDVNRTEASATLIPQVSDGQHIPGNQSLTSAHIDARKELLLRPYHQAIQALLAERADNGLFSAVISVHSFTPTMQGAVRPWHVGVLWDKDGGMVAPVIAHLRGRGNLAVGDNEPYSARGIEGYTMAAHAEAHSRPNVLFEVRQDLLATSAGIVQWANTLSAAIRSAGDVTQLLPSSDNTGPLGPARIGRALMAKP